MSFLTKPIKSYDDLKDYIDNLAKHDMLYHFDEDAKDILSSVSGFSEPAFTDKQCNLLNARTAEMLELDYEYAFDYVVNNYLNN